MACGGTAIIDPTEGAGGATASSGNGATVTSSTQTTSSAGRSCAELNAAYEQAFKEAQRCDLNAPTNPCTAQENTTLECPCAAFFVNPGHPSFDALEELRSAYLAQGCDDDQDCPSIGCVQPIEGACVPAPEGGGVCQSS